MIEGGFLAHVRETVTIVRPMPSSVPRGNNTSRTQQPTRSLRINEDQLIAIDEAAQLMGMTRSSYMSWCSYQVALDLIKQHREYLSKTTK